MERSENKTGREFERHFREVYEQYRGAVQSLVARRIPDRELARDLVQEVFVRVFRDFDRFDPDKGSLYTWIRALAFQELGHYFQRARAEKRRADLISIEQEQDTSVWDVPDTRFDPVRRWESDEAYEEFLEAMEHLSPELRDYVLHYYFHNRTRKQLAARYGVAEATVMRRISAAKIELRRYLKKL